MNVATIHNGFHLGWLDYSVFIIYLLVTVSIGIFFSKGQKDTKSYLLAGRSMKSVVVAITVLASVFSGISYLGFPAEAYSYGMGYSLLALSSFVTTPVINMVFMPFFHRVKLYSAYQYLEARFAMGIRTLISIIYVTRTLLWLSVVIYAPALAMEHVTGFPLWLMILIMGSITTFYTALGGMKAVIWGDVLQFIVLMGGLVAVVIVAVIGTPDGLAGVYTTAREAGRLSFNFSWDPTIRVTVWGILIGATVHNLVLLTTDQTAVQRYMTARNLKTAKKSMWIKAVIWIPCSFLFYFAGLVIFTFYQSSGQDPVVSKVLSNPDQILPYFVVNELPVGFAGLIIAGIVAASMSSISSGIHSMTTVSLVDLYSQYSRNEATEKQKVAYSRLMTITFGVVITLIAFVAKRFGTLIEAPVRIFGLLGGPLFGLFLLGMLTERTNAKGAIIGWITGTITAMTVAFFTDISFLWYALVGVTTCIIVGRSTSMFWPAPERSKITGFTWNTRYESGDTES